MAGVSKRFGDVHALTDATLEVAAGEVVAVLGPSGSGKSTLFRCITRLTEPDAGSIRVNGQSIDPLSATALRRARGEIGVVFQQFNLVRRRSALANVMTAKLELLPLWRVAFGLYPKTLQDRAVGALQAVGLERQQGNGLIRCQGGNSSAWPSRAP